jgi:hypothetical protein
MSILNLTGRDRALLRAVAAGRCEIAPTGVPNLRVDGRWFCDQPRAHVLLSAGLITRPLGAATATLTRAGRAALDDAYQRTAA